jgi:hypothetical protein
MKTSRFPLVVVLLALVGVAAAAVLFVTGRAVRSRTVGARGGGETSRAEGGGAFAGQVPSLEATQGFLYGRVATLDGGRYEGRLRFGGGEEAFWSDTFNGKKSDNAWASLVAPERLPKQRVPLAIFGIKLAERQKPRDLSRLFMTRLGDIVRIEASGNDVRVTLKSGATVELDRFEASDFDDGVRVWDRARGVVDIDSSRIRSIDLLPMPAPRAETPPVPTRLHGTARTVAGSTFSGFVQWERLFCVGEDELVGKDSSGGEVRLRFDTLRSIARSGSDSVRATLLDGRETTLDQKYFEGPGHRGTSVDDPRYGRVLVPWDSLDRLDFTPATSGPAYDEFPAGSRLAGTLTTRAGQRLSGLLVYDLDESETTDTFDAPAGGVDYTIPFGMIRAIVVPERAPTVHVVLRSGEELELERKGDASDANAGALVFVDGEERPEYLSWDDIARIDLELGSPSSTKSTTP